MKVLDIILDYSICAANDLLTTPIIWDVFHHMELMFLVLCVQL